MPKRKAGVNDIIYELDNDDIEISSEDEVKDAKIQRSDSSQSNKTHQNDPASKENSSDVINLDCSLEGDCVIVSPTKTHNGGKTLPNVSKIELDGLVEKPKPTCQTEAAKQTGSIDSKKSISECSQTTILNEDIIIDSPASNSDLGVVGCENRTALVTVRFRDKKLAKKHKGKVKTFLLNLLQLANEDEVTGSETETDLELDVWPEDLLDDADEPMVVAGCSERPTTPDRTILSMISMDTQATFGYNSTDMSPVEESNLFFVDTAPGGMEYITQVPTYRQHAALISNIPEKEPTPIPTFRRGPTCFNCDGAHALRDCTLPRNNSKINENRSRMVKIGRYHVEDDQKYGHLIPGRISGQLRHALGLKRHELPLHIYMMRTLGYPPGWLEDARISHSGITMFDSTGQEILDPEDEEGELCEPGSKDKFDIKKIHDFPGFNVPASSRYKDEAHLLGFKDMSEHDSKLMMLQMLAPNAMKAYKRKKLAMFPSASNHNSFQEGQAEMELDSGDETAEFPTVPPLPDEAPPPAPPPPPPPPSDDLEVIEVTKVSDIPVPLEDMIIIDEVSEDTSQPSSGRESPTLDDLEIRKQKLLKALQGNVIVSDASENEAEPEKYSVEEETDTNKIVEEVLEETETPKANEAQDNESQVQKTSTQDPKTPSEKTGHVKSSELGTPVMNIASSFTKLPTDDKFSKDICDVINFENLPNSTGKYKQICSLLKKVKSEVDRIQDS